MHSTSGVISAVDVDAGPGDERRPLACEEGDRRADFFGTAVASEGSSRLLHFSERAVGRIHLRIDRTRLNDIDGNAFGPEVSRPAAGVRGDGGLRRRVVGDAGPWRRAGGAGADRDDATA